MPFNVLLLPLLGGYIFISYWNRTRFDAKRYSGERLLLHSALAGIVFLVASFALVSTVATGWPVAYERSHRLVPFEHSGTSLGALLLGTTIWWPLNWFSSRPKEIKRTIEAWNDYLELLLHQALEETRHVAVTLKNGKVYIGFVVRSFDPSYDRKYIVVLPTISGYRDSEKHSLTLTTDYTAVYQQLIEEDESRLTRGVDDFQIVVPVSEILSANLFDWVAFERFNPPEGADTGEQ